MGRDSPAIPLLARVCLIATLATPGLAEATVTIPMPPPQVWVAPVGTPAAVMVLQPANSPLIMVQPSPDDTGMLPDSCSGHLAVSVVLDWMDLQHCWLSGRTGSTISWFDHLFGTSDPDRASALVRVVTEVQLDKKNGTQFINNIQASVRLPNADRRLRLVISDDRADFAETSKNISPEQQRLQSAAATAALRFLAYTHNTLRMDTDFGLRSGPDLFVRGRIRDSWSLTPDSDLRASQTVRYATRDEGRSISELDLERLLGQNSGVTLGNQLSWWEKEDHTVGMRWNQGVSFRHDLGMQQAWSFGIGTEGVTRPAWARESYGIWALWRHALWRDWVFYEVEPRLTRYRQFDWSMDPSITLRLELQFGRK